MGKRSRRKQARREAEGLRNLTESLARDLGPLGITIDQAFEMVRDGVEKMAQRMAEAGSATRAPWGVAYDHRALEKTLQTALLMMFQGVEAVDERGDAPDLSDAESARIVFETIGGAVTAAAAGILWLSSQPLPYELARHLIANENPAEP